MLLAVITLKVEGWGFLSLQIGHRSIPPLVIQRR
jgi:hypothetical protein